MSEPELAKLSEAAEACGIPTDVLKMMAADGLLPQAVRGKAGHVYFPRNEIPSISADIAITVMVLLDGSWLLGSFGLSFFSMLSVYLVFFDGPKALASHVAWILLTTAAFAVRIGVDAEFDVVEFTAQTVLAAALAMGTPLGVQAAIWALHNDAKESVTDPLTGLLNRRGLYLHVGGLVDAGVPQGDARLVVMVVDLDRFKSVNDTFDHAVGDEVLIRSARRIKSAMGERAMVARVGGEEFVVVDILDQGTAMTIAERVLSAVAAPARRAPITASVGVSSVSLAEYSAADGDLTEMLETIIGHADHAMFDVKNRGGNAAIHIPATGS